jgi:hypothetical protein
MDAGPSGASGERRLKGCSRLPLALASALRLGAPPAFDNCPSIAGPQKAHAYQLHPGAIFCDLTTITSLSRCSALRYSQCQKYDTLLKILDQIRAEGAASGFSSYEPSSIDLDLINQARSRAYIHLFIKVKFGVLNFRERETYITDGAQDGGIDGYFIDRESKTVFFLQSKFRTTERNFETKRVTLDEIASMDIARISSGHESDEAGIEYNGKIKGLIRTIAAIEDIGRYKYRVVIIANLRGVSNTTLRNLIGGFSVEHFDAERCYAELVFPVLSGTYFQKEDLSIFLDLSNKNAGAKISYEVSTTHGLCDITVLFVPTLEIAKIMHKYKNAILKHNPRSYLEFDGAIVNESIRDTILKGESNEFALLNNGITMISDETNISEKIGQKNKAQLLVKNPQIINGGQTAYTLSRIYETNRKDSERIFAGKEVLLKVITLAIQSPNSHTNNVKLIDQISTATNRQTAVTNSDRHSNEEGFELLQKVVFHRYGVLFERKRGEFGDGIRDGYLAVDQVLERNTFAKIYFAANGALSIGRARRAFLHLKEPSLAAQNPNALDRFYLAYRYYLAAGRPPLNRRNRASASMIFAFTTAHSSKDVGLAEEQISARAEEFERAWAEFIRKRDSGEFVGRKNVEQRKFKLNHPDKLRGDILEYFGPRIEGEDSATDASP